MFSTGSHTVPPLGFEGLSLDFQHNPSVHQKALSTYPLANTCNLTLTLPTVHQAYHAFETAMVFGIKNAQEGFGFA